MHHDSDKLYRLDGKVALVTGAARGIGFSAAELLAQGGAKVMLSDVLDAEGKAAVSRLREQGLEVDYLPHDVADEGAWERVVAQTIERFGAFDVLVNNAGVHLEKRLTDTTAAELRRVLAVNVEGVYFGIKHAFIAMRPGGAAGRGGSVINVSSVAGIVGGPGVESAYSASKGAVRLVTKASAIEAGQLSYGIRINSVHPGVVITPMAHEGMSQACNALGVTLEQLIEGLKQIHVIGRLGQPLDIAAAIRFLASDASSWMTGSELVVDGGVTCA